MRYIDEVLNELYRVRNEIVCYDSKRRTRPRLAIYMTTEFYHEVASQISCYGRVSHAEFELVNDHTLHGVPVYEVVRQGINQSHPPFSVLHAGWEEVL